MLILKNAKILTMVHKEPLYADITIEDGKIVALGDLKNADHGEKQHKVIDLQGRTVTPGFVDAHSHIGIFEDSIGFEGDDGNEMTDPITPQLRAIDGINPADRSFEEALRQGVTSVVTGPGSANVLGGQFAALKTYGSTIEEMCIDPCVAMKIAFGENPKRVYSQKDKAPMTRMASVGLLREAMMKAKNHQLALKLAQKNGTLPPVDVKSDALIKVLNREISLKAHAHRADDIMAALRIAEEFGCDITIDHCTEGHLIPSLLKEKNAKVILGPIMLSRFKVEMKNLSQEAPRILNEAGIDFALATDHPEIPEFLLRTTAAYCVCEGLNEYDALRAITINAAEITGIAHRVGSIEVNKDADLVVFGGDPLDIRNMPLLVIVDGEVRYQAPDFCV